MSASVALADTLARKRRRAAQVLWTERLVRHLGPAAIPSIVFLCAASLGWLRDLPPWPHIGLLLAILAATATVTWRGIARLIRPLPPEIDRLLESHGGDAHRPLATLADRAAWPGEAAVWQAHQDRALARIDTLRPGWPRLRRGELAGIAAATTALTVCLAAAATSGPAQLWDALTPRLPATPPPHLQAWIVPPRSTGLAPIFLHPGDPAPITAPLGSHLTVSLAGGLRVPTLQYGATARPFQRLDRTSFQADLTLHGSATLVISRAAMLARWTITAAADQPPTIRLAGTPGRRDSVLLLPWTAADDYGLSSVTADMRLRDRPALPPAQIHLPIEGNPRHAAGSALPDLTAHPWAGLPVRLHYVATDGAGQHGASAEVVVTLPERPFANPLARALIGLRRRLVTDPAPPTSIAADLDQLCAAAAAQLSAGQWLNLRGIAALLAQRRPMPGDAAARLWQLALAIEDAGVSDAKQHLADARHALDDALATPAGANRQQRIEALTRQLQQAMQHYLQALQQQAMRGDQSQTQPLQGNGRTVDAAQLQQMARQLADAARAGRTEEAEARLRDLGALLDSLRPAARSATPGQASPPRDGALDKLLQDQGALQSHADRRLSEDADPRASPGPERDPDEAAGEPDAGKQRKSDAAGQGALRRRLGDLADRLGATSGQIPDGLAKADAAMRDAAGALSRGDDAAASGAQQRALDGLRQSGSELSRQASQEPGQPGGPPAPGQDPLGRTEDAGGQNPDEDDVALPTKADAADSRAIRDELRRRAADRTRRQQELDYLDRLLKSE